MSQRSFKPLPQTQREAPGTRWKVMMRVCSFAAGPARAHEPMQGWYLADGNRKGGLAKQEAEILLRSAQNAIHGGWFEYALIPWEQEKP